MFIRNREILFVDGIGRKRFWKNVVFSLLTSLVVIETGCFRFPNTLVEALDKEDLKP